MIRCTPFFLIKEINSIVLLTSLIISSFLSSCGEELNLDDKVNVEVVDSEEINDTSSDKNTTALGICDTRIYGDACSDMDNFILVKKDEIKPEYIRSGASIGGIKGKLTDGRKSYLECSSDGELNCISTETYKALNINNHLSKIANTENILGVKGKFVIPDSNKVFEGISYGIDGNLVGSLAYCNGNDSGCYLKPYSQGVSGYKLQALNYDGIYDKRSNIKNGYEIISGVVGTQSLCEIGSSECYINENSLKAVELDKLIASNIKTGVSLGLVVGDYEGDYLSCTDSSHVGCIATEEYPSVQSSLTGSLLSSASINGVNGGISNCSSGGSSCYINGDSLKAVESSRLVATNIKNGVSLGGVGGSYMGDQSDCSGSVHTGCVAISSYPSVPASLTSSLLASASINGVNGEISDCSAGGSSCYINGDSFKAVESSKLLASNIKHDVSLGLVTGVYTGPYSECSSTSHTECIAVEDYPSVPIGLTSSLLASANINGSNGEIDNCSTGGSLCYINGNTFKAVESSLLLASNIKKDVVIGGVTGAYPSSTYRLVGSTGTVDLVESNFNSLMIGNSSFEWFDANGNRYSSTGDNDIVASNIRNGVDVFGVVGEYGDPIPVDMAAHNYYASALKKKDGTVVCVGSSSYGGDCSGLSSSLVNVVKVFSTKAFALAALKSDGSVVTWGADYAGDSSSVSSSLSSGVVNIFSNYDAFAALKSDGSVVTWGDPSGGGDSSSPVGGSLSSGVINIFSTNNAFAALKSDGSVVTWGNANYGGDFTYEEESVTSKAPDGSLSSGVVKIFSTYGAFAALKSDGSVVTWGTSNHGGVQRYYSWNEGRNIDVSSSLESGVTNIFSVTAGSFAALKSDGSVVTWGYSDYGGDSSSVSSSLSSGVVNIFSNPNAFAALKSDGSVVTWGDPDYGSGNSSSVSTQLSSGVVDIVGTYGSFAALKSDGSVVVWGSDSYGGNMSLLSPQLSSGVISIFSNGGAFAAIKSDGTVVAWGSYGGGDTSAIMSYTGSSSLTGITNIFGGPTYFIGVREDDSYVVWGYLE